MMKTKKVLINRKTVVKMDHRRLKIFVNFKSEKECSNLYLKIVTNLIKVNRRSTLTDNQLEDCFGSDIFTDESSEYSGKSDEINAIPLTSSF